MEQCFRLIGFLSIITIFTFMPSAWALDDGWYSAKSATGSCSGSMMRTTVAVDKGAPVSLSFSSESFAFPAPIKPAKAAKIVKMIGPGEQFDVSIAEPSKNMLALRVIGGECNGAQIIYGPK